MQDAWHDSEGGALAAERRWQRRVIGGANRRVAARRAAGEPGAPWRPRRG
jgi:hypothetical protein